MPLFGPPSDVNAVPSQRALQRYARWRADAVPRCAIDDARYGSICSAPVPETLRTLEATIAAAINKDRYPRLACQLGAWRKLAGRWIHALEIQPRKEVR